MKIQQLYRVGLKTMGTVLMTLLLWGGGVVSQTTPMYSQYRFDGLAINPAFAGANDALSFNFIHRSQWIGIENAPSTSTFLMHGPLWNNRIGLGLNLSADKVGIDSRFSLTGNYAYRFHFQKSILALGLNGGISYYNVKWGTLDAAQSGDVAFPNNGESLMVPSFGAGLYYYSQRFFFGLSVPMLLNESEISDSGETTFYNQNRHYFLTSGILINFAENFQFKPSFLVKYVHNVPAQIDMNASFKLYDIVWFGLTYRTNNSYTVMFQYELDKTTLFGNRRLKIGYAFDIAQSEIRGEVGGTHEFFVSYSFRKNKTKVLNPKDFE